MAGFQPVDWMILVLYMVAMAAIGPLCARSGRTTEGYFLGSRSFSGWLVGLSMFATSISSVTFMAYPADAYKTAYIRFVPCLMLPLGVLLCSYIFLPFYRKARIISAFEYLESRFGPGIRLYAASMFVLGQLIRLSLVLYLVSLLVYEMSRLDPMLCILIGGVVTAFYTITGGIKAVLWTDFIQSFLLWGGGLVCLLVIVFKLEGGFGEIFSVAMRDGKFMLGDLNRATGELERAPWGFALSEKTVIMMLLVGLTGWMTEYSSNQNVIQRFCASASPTEARKAIWICCVCSVPTWGFFMFLGTSLYVFFQAYPTPEAQAMLDGTMKADQILPYFVVHYLPPGMSGLVIAGVLAAAMSSLSSSINAVSAIGIVDIYRRHVMKGKSDTHYVVAAKLIALGASLVMIGGAMLLMIADSKTMQDTGAKIGAVTAGGLLGLYSLGFLTKRGDARAVGVGIVCTILFSLWIASLEMGWITEARVLMLGLPQGFASWFVKPMDTYYAGIFGNIIMFVVGYLLGSLVFVRKGDLTNLTVWTRDGTPEV